MEAQDDVVRYRLQRAHEALQDARVLANADRWSACEYAASSITTLSRPTRSPGNWLRCTTISLPDARKVITWILSTSKLPRFAPGFRELSNWSGMLPH